MTLDPGGYFLVWSMYQCKSFIPAEYRLTMHVFVKSVANKVKIEKNQENAGGGG